MPGVTLDPRTGGTPTLAGANPQSKQIALDQDTITKRICDIAIASDASVRAVQSLVTLFKEQVIPNNTDMLDALMRAEKTTLQLSTDIKSLVTISKEASDRQNDAIGVMKELVGLNAQAVDEIRLMRVQAELNMRQLSHNTAALFVSAVTPRKKVLTTDSDGLETERDETDIEYFFRLLENTKALNEHYEVERKKAFSEGL